MKKKIGDLTLKEIKNMCLTKPLAGINCNDCPVYELCQCLICNYKNEDLDKEIEVDE